MNFNPPGPDPHNPSPGTGKVHLDTAALPEIDRRERLLVMDRKQIVDDFLERTIVCSGGDPAQLKSGELLLNAARCKMPDIKDPYWWPDCFYVRPGTAEVHSEVRQSALLSDQLHLVAGYRNTDNQYVTHHIDPWGRERWSVHLHSAALMELAVTRGDGQSLIGSTSHPLFSVREAEMEVRRLDDRTAQERWKSNYSEEGSFLFTTILQAISNNPETSISPRTRDTVTVWECAGGDGWSEPRKFLAAFEGAHEFVVTVSFRQNTFHAIDVEEL